MLDLADRIPNPIAPVSLCAGSNLLTSRINRNNSVLDFEFSALCGVDAVAGVGVNSDERLLVLEGQITSRILDNGINVEPVHEMFKLKIDDKDIAGLAQASAALSPNFARPLDPLEQRRFKVVYAISRQFSGLTKVWHPAHNNEIEAELAQIDALDKTRPTIPKVESDKVTTKETPTTKPTNSASQFCREPADWFTPSKGSNALFELSITGSCFFDESRDRLIVEGKLASLQTTKSVTLPDAAVLFQLQMSDRRLKARKALESELAPDFAGELRAQSEKTFAVMFELGDGSNGPLSLHIPMRSAPLQLAFGELPSVQDQPASEPIVLDLDLDPEDEPSGAKKTRTSKTDPAPESEPKSKAPSPGQLYSLVPNLDPKSVGALISRASDGAKITVTRGGADKDPVLLLNGLRGTAENNFTLTPDGLGVSELLITFPNGAIAELAGFWIDSRSRTVHTPVPSSVQVFVSETGDAGPWTDLGKIQIPHRDKQLLSFAFAKPQMARAIRIALTGWTHRLILSEIDVVETTAPKTGSAIAGIQTNLADQSNGGRIVRFTSQGKSWPAFGLLRNDGAWFPEKYTFPQDIIVAFAQFKKMDVSDITIDWNLAKPENWKPRVKILASNDPGPLGNYVELGTMTEQVISETAGKTMLQLPNPTAIKWLKITVSDPGTNQWALRQLHVNGLLSQIRSVSGASTDLISSAKFDASETEPNDTFETALALPMNKVVSGQSNNDNDVDYYTFNVEGSDPQVVAFRLTGRQWIRTRLELIDSTGSTLFTHNPLVAETTHEFTWKLLPGRYAVRLQEPSSGISMVIDDSGSMGDAIHVAKKAAQLFAQSKRPEERLSLFRFSGPVRQLSPLTEDGQKLAELVMTGIDQSEPSGTAVFDAVVAGMDSLAEAQGNRAVILLTDGEDVSSKLTYPAFWDAVEKRRVPIYAIGLGKAMRNFDDKVSARLDHMLQAFALGSGGAYFDSPSAGDLQSVWKQIADRIRNRGGYSLQWRIPGPGSLAVLETGEEFVAADALGDILFVLDASGSMRATTDQGRKRIDIAKTILFDMLNDVPESARVGLRVYGSQVDSKPKQLSCRDSILAVPISTGSRAQTIRTVAALSPKGQTPIGRSLAAVREDMAAAQKGLVVLLTDGEETCDADPADPYYPNRVAKELRDSGLDVRVNIVGFDVNDPKVQQDLSRVAQATGGTFFAAEGEAGLRKALREAFAAPVVVLDDLNQVIVETKVGAAPVQLAAAHYRLKIGGQIDLAPPQHIEENKELRLYINKEGTEVRTSSEIVAPNTPLKEGIRVNLRPAVSPEKQAQLDQLIVQEINTRPPSTTEESTYRVQAMLTDLGYKPGSADGKIGPATRRAISGFVQDHGLIAGTSAYDAKGNPGPMLWISVFGVHVSALLRPILFDAEIPPDVAARLR